jgi:carbonic anhydrase/acetyltransferase-like protein (isoleucine patch superfamily)
VPVYALGDLVPRIDPTAFVHPDAVVIGKVTIGAESTVWPCAVLRGDGAGITIGARTSVQDGAVLHNTEVLPTVVGDDCTIGHLAHLEGCTVEDGALVGTASIVLHEAVVGTGALVGANAVVTGRTNIPPGAMALGVPAKIREGASDPQQNLHDAQHYVERGRRYREQLRRVDFA